MTTQRTQRLEAKPVLQGQGDCAVPEASGSWGKARADRRAIASNTVADADGRGKHGLSPVKPGLPNKRQTAGESIPGHVRAFLIQRFVLLEK